MADVRVSRRAERDLARIPPIYLGAVASALRRLGPKPLAGKMLGGDLEGLRSLRVGMYRVVYRFDPRTKIVEVIWNHHRREAYR